MPCEKDSDSSLWVMHIPAEDESIAGAQNHQARRGMYEQSSNDGETGNGLQELTPQGLCGLEVEEDEGPGAWERDIELVDEMASGKLKTPYNAEGAFRMNKGSPVEAMIA